MKTNYFPEVPSSLDKTDHKKLARYISDKATDIQKARVEAADDIIASEEQTKRELKEEISLSVDDILRGLEGMHSTFEWGFSELVWQIEKQRETLKGILEALQKPLGTQAKELKRRAEKAYANGLYDDALRDFLESKDKNPYDFTVYHNIGNIYFLHEEKPKKALKFYKKAVKYAESDSPYHASYSLLHIGLIEYIKENVLEAYNATNKAVNLSPYLMEARYQHSKYAGMLKKNKELKKHLRIAILNDKTYALKVSSDEDFNEVQGVVSSLIRELTKEIQNLAVKKDKLIKWIIHTINTKELLNDSTSSQKLKRNLNKTSKQISVLLDKKSLFEAQKAVNIADSVIGDVKQSLIEYLVGKINDKKSSLKDKLESEKRKLRGDKKSTFKGVINNWFTGNDSWGVFGILFDVVLSLPYSIIAYPWIKRSIKKREKNIEKIKNDLRNIKNSYESDFPLLHLEDKTLKYRNRTPLEVNKGCLFFSGEESHCFQDKLVSTSDSNQLRNFILEVDAKKILGSDCKYGINFRWSGGNGEFYAFLVSTSGQYELLRQIKEEREWETIIRPTQNTAINKNGRWNTLKIVAKDELIGLYVNNEKLETVHEANLIRGYFGINTSIEQNGSDLVTIFDNIKVQRLEHF